MTLTVPGVQTPESRELVVEEIARAMAERHQGERWAGLCEPMRELYLELARVAYDTMLTLHVST